MNKARERLHQVLLAYGRDCAEAGEGIVNPDFYLEHMDRHLAELERHLAEAAKAILALEYRLRGARFILDGIQHMYPGVGLERSTARLQVIALIDQTLKETAAAFQRAQEHSK